MVEISKYGSERGGGQPPAYSRFRYPGSGFRVPGSGSGFRVPDPDPGSGFRRCGYREHPPLHALVYKA